MYSDDIILNPESEPEIDEEWSIIINELKSFKRMYGAVSQWAHLQAGEIVVSSFGNDSPSRPQKWQMRRKI
jgi:hypothetical protein